jgi:mannose-6-phosphate isomerase-like protein (cupin superfamily)
MSLETVTAGDGQVLAYIARGGSEPGETRFLTPDDCNLQVGHVVYPAGASIVRHMHLPVERQIVGTTEVLIVQRGRCEVDVFSTDRTLVRTFELGAGDILIALGGGHGFRLLEDTVLLEIKQGPYAAGGDKERF